MKKLFLYLTYEELNGPILYPKWHKAKSVKKAFRKGAAIVIRRVIRWRLEG